MAALDSDVLQAQMSEVGAAADMDEVSRAVRHWKPNHTLRVCITIVKRTHFVQHDSTRCCLNRELECGSIQQNNPKQLPERKVLPGTAVQPIERKQYVSCGC